MNLRHAAELALVGILFLPVASCSSRSHKNNPAGGAASQSDGEYLNNAVGKASEDEIASTLGSPSEKQELGNGGHVWIYRYKYQKTRLIFGHRSMCTQHVLAFDASKTLQKWSDNRCSEESGAKAK